MRLRFARAGTLAVAFALTALASAAAAREVGDAIPASERLGERSDGTPITAGDLAGKPALIVFWASWCGNCARELPTADQLQRRWGERATVLGISTDRSPRDLRRFLRKLRARFSFQVAYDASRDAARNFAVRELPTNVLVDANGVVRWHRVGFGPGWLGELADALRAMPRQSVPAAADEG